MDAKTIAETCRDLGTLSYAQSIKTIVDSNGRGTRINKNTSRNLEDST